MLNWKRNLLNLKGTHKTGKEYEVPDGTQIHSEEGLHIHSEGVSLRGTKRKCLWDKKVSVCSHGGRREICIRKQHCICVGKTVYEIKKLR
jgi:hypothetical protein